MPSPRSSELAGPAFCSGCGRAEADCDGTCRRDLDPPRFCPTCGRRSRVDVTPAGYESRCRDHGVFATG